MSQWSSTADIQAALSEQAYLVDEGLATALFLAQSLGQPLLLEGEPGVGKTAAAKAMAAALSTELLRLQCYEGIAANEALYEWNYPKQLLSIRLSEADGEKLSDSDLFTTDFLVERPLLAAVRHSGPTPAVVLIDEIDRADDEFEAFLLEALSDYSVTVPELGSFKAEKPPMVIITSNRTRDVHDALKRRALYHWVEHPDFEREVQIITRKAPNVPAALARQVASATGQFRDMGMYKPPGIAETLDWANALHLLAETELTAESVDATLGTLLKYREDQERARRAGIESVIEIALGA